MGDERSLYEALSERGVAAGPGPSLEERAGLVGKIAQFVHGQEGFRGMPYDDATGKSVEPGAAVKGKVTVGWGTVLEAEAFEAGWNAGEFPWSEDQANKAYESFYREHMLPGLRRLERVYGALTDEQYVAAASFIYNAGPTAFRKNILKPLEERDLETAVHNWSSFVKRNVPQPDGTVRKEVSPGLVQRREEEIALFLSGFADE